MLLIAGIIEFNNLKSRRKKRGLGEILQRKVVGDNVNQDVDILVF